MKSKERGPVILVLSDAHLGAGKSEYQLLHEFLREILRRDQENEVKAIILLGDFFDICLENYRNLKEKFYYIFEDLIQLQKKMPVVFSLGNHEISVTGDIETNFKERRNLFIKEFRSKEILRKKNIGQYIGIINTDSNIRINLYSSINTFDKGKSDIKSVNIKLKSKNAGKFNCLLTHGHQFEDEATFSIGKEIWSALIDSKSSTIKKIVNFIWNTCISGYRSIKGLTKLELDSIINRIRISLTKDFIRKWFDGLLKWEKFKDKNKNEPYYDRIKRFIKEKISFQNLTHVIFGHTHKMGSKQINVNNKDISIYNSGSWQKKIKPTYLEINLDNLEVYMKRMRLTKDLSLLRMFNNIFDIFNLAFREELIKNNPQEKDKILEYSHTDIFNEAKNQNIISQEHYDNIEKYLLDQQTFFSKTKETVSLEEVIEDINGLKDIYTEVLLKKPKKLESVPIPY
ncbi:MAG: metallophosphoesterase [Promethearchaeota archaeon]